MCDSEDTTKEIKEKAVFKAKKRKNLRQRIKTDESDDEGTTQIMLVWMSLVRFICDNFPNIFFRDKLENLKEIQSLRKRPHGVSVIGLALGTKVSIEDEVTVSFHTISKLGFFNVNYF